MTERGPFNFRSYRGVLRLLQGSIRKIPELAVEQARLLHLAGPFPAHLLDGTVIGVSSDRYARACQGTMELRA
jgi:hypothetical protein